MKKTLSAVALSVLGISSATYAGTMGEEKTLPMFIPFFAGEALYSWPEVDGFNINVENVGTFRSEEDNQGWGGRLAVGGIHPFTETWAGSMEVGWGYYGSVDMNPKITLSSNVNTADVTVVPSANAFSSSIDQYGFDILAGVFYMQPQYDLFFKVGALIQNLRFKVNANPQQLTADDQSSVTQRLNGNYSLQTTIVNALPMLRLGGGYHLSEDWLFTASWMHAFGSTLSISAPNVTRSSSSSLGSFGDISSKISSPTLNVVLFGLEYRFM